ncbi:MAG: hypothetical protein IMZ52_07770 [Actinobacteria bacterium]|nr:hypothetical protein [Actinomycetota bacterium]
MKIKEEKYIDKMYAGYCKKCKNTLKKEFAATILGFLLAGLVFLVSFAITYIDNNIIHLTLVLVALLGLLLLFYVYFNQINVKLEINFKR